VRTLKTVGWGLYLTCSWTWCIGMFLPVILMHRYGWLGFLIFTVPNVIGCAAFGYVVKTPERSKALVEKYKTAISLFAIVTIAFHAFFIAMLANMHVPEFSIWIPIGILVIASLLSFLPTRLWPVLAGLLWCFSILLGITLLPIQTVPQGSLPWQDAIWLLPITTFGFFLCPYLDPTFHRALQCSPSKHSFGIFGFTFILMVLVTYLYQGTILSALTILLGLHLALQSIFTISAHIKEGLRIESISRKGPFIAVGVFAYLVAIAIAHRPGTTPELAIDDYLRFFVFYGLVFPGVVATFMLTDRVFTPLRIALFALVALLSLPLLEVGYIGNQAWLSVLPVIVLLTWAFADRNTYSTKQI